MKWFIEMRDKKIQVLTNDIKLKALELGPINFKASDGWLEKFLKRNKISYRCTTKIVQQLRDDSHEKIIDFLGKIMEFMTKFKLRNNGIEPVSLNFDETPIYLNNSKYFLNKL
jgi:hypothetical protein